MSAEPDPQSGSRTTRQDAAAKYELPFGSFLGVAAIGVAFYVEPMLKWWTRLGA